MRSTSTGSIRQLRSSYRAEKIGGTGGKDITPVGTLGFTPMRKFLVDDDNLYFSPDTGTSQKLYKMKTDGRVRIADRAHPAQ